MNKSLSNKIKDSKDVFGAYFLENAIYDGEYDIPFVQTPNDLHLPSKLIAYSKIGTDKFDDFTYLHFYEFDYKFDGRYGIWNSLIQNAQFKKGFNLNKISGVYAVICPDFSIYNDMPRVMQIWNIYRSRACGHFFNSHGINSIPNIRWTDANSYNYCFLGIKSNSIVAVSTLGCLRSNADKGLFYPGLVELIKRKKPNTIILYGSINKKIIEIFNIYHQDYVFFPSDIANAMESKYGNEG